jgi:hypothetical protein
MHSLLSVLEKKFISENIINQIHIHDRHMNKRKEDLSTYSLKIKMTFFSDFNTERIGVLFCFFLLLCLKFYIEKSKDLITHYIDVYKLIDSLTYPI